MSAWQLARVERIVGDAKLIWEELGAELRRAVARRAIPHSVKGNATESKNHRDVLPTEEEVRRFLESPKGLSDPMEWQQTRSIASSLTPVETDGVQIGFVRCIRARPPGKWKFILEIIGPVAVYRWDIAPPTTPANHRNPRHRPREFPSRVKDPVHEHVWRNPPGDTNLARPLPDAVRRPSYAESFEQFCRHVTIDPGDHFREPPQEVVPLFDHA
jgi:hypothetical protein